MKDEEGNVTNLLRKNIPCVHISILVLQYACLSLCVFCLFLDGVKTKEN